MNYKQSNCIQETVKNDLCAGCGLCQSIFGQEKVQIDLDEKGFLRPTILQSLSKEEEQLFKKVCPGEKIDHDNPESIKDVIWGDYQSLSIGYSNDENVRHIGSSGGVISALLIYLLEEKIIDGVIHIGVNENKPLINEIKFSTTVSEILNNSGSRYSPSAPLININEFLEQSKKYAFVGKPCDVAALKMYAKQDQRVNEKIKYTFSFFCAGVPSMEGTRKILEKFEVKENEVKSFRYRGEGWPGYTKIVTKDNRSFKMSYDDSWGKILNRHLQRRCKICIDGIGEFADIACGDAWYGDEKGYPKFDEKKGRSIIISRNSNSERLLQHAVEKGYLTIEKQLAIEELEKIQPFQFDRRRTLVMKIISMRLFGLNTPKYSSKIMRKSASKSTVNKLIKTFLGTSKRIVKGTL